VVSDVGHDIRGHLTHHGLLGYFGACVLSFEHGAVKPDPRLFLSASGQLGVAPERTLMVGDTAETDGGAIAAGMTALILPSASAGTVRGLGAYLALVAPAAVASDTQQHRSS
jgi:FMN phosphatase YigB (HAD superfamily)